MKHSLLLAIASFFGPITAIAANSIGVQFTDSTSNLIPASSNPFLGFGGSGGGVNTGGANFNYAGFNGGGSTPSNAGGNLVFGQSWSNFQDNTGAPVATIVTLGATGEGWMTVNADNSPSSGSNYPASNPLATLLRGGMQVRDAAPNNDNASFTISGVPYAIYDLWIAVQARTGGDRIGYPSGISINGGTSWLVTKLGQDNLNQQTAAKETISTYTGAQGTGAPGVRNNATVNGNYVVFRGLSGDTTVTLSGYDGVDGANNTLGSRNNRIQALQIVDQSGPSLPLVTLGLAGDPLAEAGGVATVNATLSAPYTSDVTVNLAFSGTATNLVDYTRSATAIVIPVGFTNGFITLTAAQDVIYEDPDETVTVEIDTVLNGIEAGSPVTATILNDDPVPPSGAVSIGVQFTDSPANMIGPDENPFAGLPGRNGDPNAGGPKYNFAGFNGASPSNAGGSLAPGKIWSGLHDDTGAPVPTLIRLGTTGEGWTTVNADNSPSSNSPPFNYPTGNPLATILRGGMQLADGSPNDDNGTLTISGVPFPTYDLWIAVQARTGGDRIGYPSGVSIDGGAHWLVTKLAQDNINQQATPLETSAEYAGAQGTIPSGATINGNYVVFRNLSGNTTITLSGYDGLDGANNTLGSRGNRIQALQIVKVGLPTFTYNSWLTSYGLTLASAPPEGDFDGELVQNALEFVFGTDPTQASSASGTLSVSSSGNDFIVSFERASASKSNDTTLSFELGNEIGSWLETYLIGTDTATSSPGVTVTASVPGFETVTLTRAILPIVPRMLVRLKVVVTPVP